MRDFDELTNEQKVQLSKCETAEDVFSFVKESGLELTDDELELISGGGDEAADEIVRQYNEWSKKSDEAREKGECPKCGSHRYDRGCGIAAGFVYRCLDCNTCF